MHLLLVVDLLTKWQTFCPFAKICVTRFASHLQRFVSLVLRLMATFANSVCSSCCPQGLGCQRHVQGFRWTDRGEGFASKVSIWSFAVDTYWSCVSDFNLYISVMPTGRKKLSQAASLTCSLASVPMRRAVCLANPSSPVDLVLGGAPFQFKAPTAGRLDVMHL